MAYCAAVEALREGVVAAARLLGSGHAHALRAACWEVADDRGLAWPGADQPPDEVRELLAPWRAADAVDQLGAVHESLLPARKRSGSFYTPAPLVDHLLDLALDPLLGAGPALVLDPACGAGHFLVPAARRIAERCGLARAEAVRWVRGVDLDPAAAEITAFRLWLLAPEAGWDEVSGQVSVGDGLRLDDEAAYDVVVGNPPFLNQLRSATVREVGVDGTAPYTDTSAVFLRHAASLVRPGGRVGMVQPMSFLSARDARPVREALRGHGGLVSMWSSATPVFEGTSVLTCAPVWERAAEQGPVLTWQGPGIAAAGTAEVGEDALSREWGFLAARTFGIPSVRLAAEHGRLGDLGPCTADFRDQYYGLVPYVREAVDGQVGDGEAELVTTGLIDPAESLWGRRPTRFAKIAYDAPVVDLDGLRTEPSLAAWAEARQVPKVLVATQGTVLEGVADVSGRWLPSVPTITVTPPAERLWHVLAVLLAPPVVALAAERYVGAGLTGRSVKLSARQLAGLPLPAEGGWWDRGAELARAAQQAATDAERAGLLGECAAAMCRAYDCTDPAVLDWWRERAGLVSAPTEPIGSPDRSK